MAADGGNATVSWSSGMITPWGDGDGVGNGTSVRVSETFLEVYGELVTAVSVAFVISVVGIIVWAIKRRMRVMAVLPVVLIYLGIADFISDATFAAVIPKAPGGSFLYQYIAVGILVGSAAVNVISLTLFFRNILSSDLEKNGPFVRWYGRHSVTFWSILALSFTGSRMMTLIHSRMFDLDKFTAPLTVRAIDKLEMWGIVTVILEDVPQLMLTAWVTQDSDSWGDSITLSTITFNCLSIALGVACKCYTLVNLADKGRRRDDIVPAEFLKAHSAYKKGSAKSWRYFFADTFSTWTAGLAPAGARSSREIHADAVVADFVARKGDQEGRMPPALASALAAMAAQQMASQQQQQQAAAAAAAAANGNATSSSSVNGEPRAHTSGGVWVGGGVYLEPDSKGSDGGGSTPSSSSSSSSSSAAAATGAGADGSTTREGDGTGLPMDGVMLPYADLYAATSSVPPSMHDIYAATAGHSPPQQRYGGGGGDGNITDNGSINGGADVGAGVVVNGFHSNIYHSDDDAAAPAGSTQSASASPAIVTRASLTAAAIAAAIARSRLTVDLSSNSNGSDGSGSSSGMNRITAAAAITAENDEEAGAPRPLYYSPLEPTSASSSQGGIYGGGGGGGATPHTTLLVDNGTNSPSANESGGGAVSPTSTLVGGSASVAAGGAAGAGGRGWWGWGGGGKRRGSGSSSAPTAGAAAATAAAAAKEAEYSGGGGGGATVLANPLSGLLAPSHAHALSNNNEYNALLPHIHANGSPGGGGLLRVSSNIQLPNGSPGGGGISRVSSLGSVSADRHTGIAAVSGSTEALPSVASRSGAPSPLLLPVHAHANSSGGSSGSHALARVVSAGGSVAAAAAAGAAAAGGSSGSGSASQDRTDRCKPLPPCAASRRREVSGSGAGAEPVNRAEW